MSMHRDSHRDERIEFARSIRDNLLQKVEPPVRGLSQDLPLSCIGLPRSLLTAQEIHITEDYTATELLCALRERKFKSEDVTRAFLRRAAIAQISTNCLTELLWDEALERARYLDSLSQPLGPLHGLPISTKENQGMWTYGKSCNSAYVSKIGAPSEQNTLHEILWKAGCVFYARTTMPQSGMQLETNSVVYGCTTNPYNRNHTAGGSSGGEGALVGMRGSLLGIGGDIGGSIRVPAAFNGIYGFKPTASRLPGESLRDYTCGKDTILAAKGPLCTDRDTITLLMQIVLDTEPWIQDKSILSQPWQPFTYRMPLKVAIQWSDGIVTPQPCIKRALTEVSNACRSSGMEVIDWESLDHGKGWHITSALYFPDGGEEVLKTLHEGEEPILPLTDFIINGQENVRLRSPQEMFDLRVERDVFRTAYAEHWARTSRDGGREVDVILGPCFPGPAPPHDCSRYWSYTSIWNLLDYPSVVFPVTHVTDQDMPDVNPCLKNEHDRHMHHVYHGNKHLGLPVNLQLISRRNCDEKLLTALRLIKHAMGRP